MPVCGHCHQRHPTVADVKACSDRSAERRAAEDRGRRQLRRDGANEVTASFLRKVLTQSEAALWKELQRGVEGHRFELQAPVLGYVPDFYCRRLKLIVEVDGSSHRGRKRHDRLREDDLRANGNEVVRLRADLVMGDMPRALAIVRTAVRKRASQVRRPRRLRLDMAPAIEVCRHGDDPLLCDKCKRIDTAMRHGKRSDVAALPRPRSPLSSSSRYSRVPGLVNKPPKPPGTISRQGY